ncbi:MAG TPA: hypothetical protein VFZ59_01730 [Verrucomicrobiae bacterium]|nr:hypothetical protein [Verrucomicrobiae bacterium]
MKAWLAALFATAIFTSPLIAQETSQSGSTNAPGPASSYSTSYTSSTPIVITEPQLVRKDEVTVKKFKVTGFLVRPFKAMRLHKAPGAVASLFQAINPFSRETITENTRFEGELSTVAWSSTIGWRAGNSGISNPVTHEGGLTALSVGR